MYFELPKSQNILGKQKKILNSKSTCENLKLFSFGIMSKKINLEKEKRKFKYVLYCSVKFSLE